MMGWGGGYGFGGVGPGRMGGIGALGIVGPVLGLLFFLGLLGLLALGAMWLVRRLQVAPSVNSSGRTGALDLVRQRLASGEISTDEYQGIRRELLE